MVWGYGGEHCVLFRPFPVVRRGLHSPRSRQVRGGAPAAPVRPASRRPRRGCLEGRAIRRARLSRIGLGFRTCEHRLLSCGQNCNRHWVVACGLCSVFSPPLCRRERLARPPGAAGRPRAASPSTAVTKTRSAAAASFARCIIVDSYYRQSGGAGSGGEPDKAGANCKEQKEFFGSVRVQVRCTPFVYPSI